MRQIKIHAEFYAQQEHAQLYMCGYYYTVPESKISDATYVAAIASLVGKNANFFFLSFFLLDEC